MKEKVILAGPFISELGWEILRSSLFVLWVKYKKHNNVAKLIVLTRPDRFDLYGKHANILIPLNIEGDYTKYKPNCFKLDNFPLAKYKQLVDTFYTQYKDKYDIIDHVYPNISKRNFLQKNQYPRNQLYVKFKPRAENKKSVDQHISNKKQWVVIAPRFRKGVRRNWPHWQILYDMIWNSDLINKFEFIIVGMKPEYVPDKHDRFFDINQIPITKNNSLIGLSMSIIYNSILTVGSQSAIPNLSLLLNTDVLEWGNQKTLHTKTYNYTNTPITFLNDMNFNIEPKKVFNNINRILTSKEKTNNGKA